MRIRNIVLCLGCIFLSILCTSCTTEVAMPYSSEEYLEMNWPVDELISHFEELGFSDFETYITETFDEDEARIRRVAIEDTSSSSADGDLEHKEFEKNEKFGTYLEVLISGYRLIPTLTVDNCDELAELVQMDGESLEKGEKITAFMRKHGGEYLEFEGTITYWNDELFFASGVYLTVAVEDSPHTNFSWNSIGISELEIVGDPDYENGYISGMIEEGDKVHMYTKINNNAEGWKLEIISTEIIE